MKKNKLLLFALCAACSLAAANDEFVMGMGDSPMTLNPQKALYSHEMQLFTGLYEGLFSYEPQTLAPLPAQAESYKKSDDGKTWTFTIRKDARWSDGSPVTANDFAESWLELLSPQTKADYAVFFDIIQGAHDYRTGKKKDKASVGIRARDKTTLVVELISPASYFTRLLCHSAFVPIHASMRGKSVWSESSIISNGAYTLSSMTAEEVVLKKSAQYWDAANVAMDTIRIERIKTSAEGTGRFNDGYIDWLTDMYDAKDIIDTRSFQVAPLFATAYYFWDTSQKPWNDARVRRALALYLPWDELRSPDRYDNPTSCLIVPFDGYRSPASIQKKNETEAANLLKLAGYPAGKGLPAMRIVYFASKVHEQNIDIMEKAWKKIGITIERIPIDGAGDMYAARKKGFTLSFTSWIGDFADPTAFLLMWKSNSGLNDASYKNTQYDKLLERSMSEEGKERMTSLSKAEEKLLADAVVMPLYHSFSVNLIDADAFAGWYANPLDIHPFKYIKRGMPKAKPNVVMALRQQNAERLAAARQRPAGARMP